MKRPEGAIVNKFDDAKMKRAIIEEVKRHNPNTDLTPEKINFPYWHYMMLQSNGVIAVINDEGVGQEEYKADGESYCKILAAVGLSFPDEFPMRVSELKKALSKDTIDLAEAIRSFGSRLDSNHYMWYRRYGSKVK